jgi:RISC-loading complex subunit TARBP2
MNQIGPNNQPSSNFVLGPLPHNSYNNTNYRSQGSQPQVHNNAPGPHQHNSRPPYYNNKPKREGKDPANMSNYETNPVGALQERFQSRGITPQYRVVQAEGASHAPTFSFQVILGDLTSTGSGSSKKQANHAAARAMLDKLDGRVPAQDGQTPLPPVQDSTNGPQAPGNTVGALQELCVKHGYPMPTYDLGAGDPGAVGGQPHQRNFSILCCVGKLRESGGGGSKKDAKREAAQKMIDKLKSMGPNNGPAQVNDVVAAGQELDEEMMSKLSNMKVETLNSGASQKVASFYRKLQTAGGTKLASLHMTSLKSRGTDFVTFLGDLGKEQKFEVTYVEVEEKSDDDLTQCLVQLSTLPVAVCYGVGTDGKTAHNDAARNALNYLKMMTKRSVGGKK